MSKTLGCFGSVLYHDPAARRCGGCHMLADCKVAVAANRVELDAIFVALQGDVKAPQTTATKRIIRKIVREQTVDAEPVVAKQPVQVKGIDKLPSKCRVLVQRWYDADVDFTAAQRGENPFTHTRNEFAKVAMDILMEHKTIAQGDFCDLLQARLQWKFDTAISHVGQIRAMFPFLGIMDISIGADGAPYFDLKV